MVVTGTARSVCVKSFIQIGFDSPEIITFLFLLGQFLSIIVYFFSQFCDKFKIISLKDKNVEECHPISDKNAVQSLEEGDTTSPADTNSKKHTMKVGSLNEMIPQKAIQNEIEIPKGNVFDEEMEKSEHDTNSSIQILHTENSSHIGSTHGLTEESEQAISWIHSIPWYLKPLIPALFNLCNAFMRWASLLYTAASIAEMLISGMELVLSVLASRWIRKRKISSFRWAGIGFVTIGLFVVGTSHLLQSHNEKEKDDEEDDGSGGSGLDGSIIGLLLIVGQCVMSVLQDLAEEVFIQASDFPPTLLLGMEGFFGLIMGSILWALIHPPQLDDLTLVDKYPYMISLTLLFTVTGIFNIMATGVTSSVTRNVWKNLRTLFVWATGLIIYYSVGNGDVGETWLVPESFIALFGFMIILSGVHVYYVVKLPSCLKVWW